MGNIHKVQPDGSTVLAERKRARDERLDLQMQRTILDEALIQAFRETRYEIDVGGRCVVLRIGERSGDAAQMLADAGATSAVFITAANPCSQGLPDEENVRRNEALRKAVVARGARVWAGVGRAADDGWLEPSLFVVGISREDADRLADRWQQNAYVWVGVEGEATLVLRR